MAIHFRGVRQTFHRENEFEVEPLAGFPSNRYPHLLKSGQKIASANRDHNLCKNGSNVRYHEPQATYPLKQTAQIPQNYPGDEVLVRPNLPLKAWGF